MKPVPIFGTGIKGISGAITAQRRVNCFYDMRQDGDKATIIVRATPGAVSVVQLTDSPIRGWRVVGNYMYVVAGATVFQVAQDTSFQVLGTITNSGQYVSMWDNSFQVGFVDGQQGYYIPINTGTPTLISDSSFPNGATTMTGLDSRAVVEVPDSTRQFYVSAQYDLSTWTPIIFATKENNSDPLIAVDVLNGMIILWGPQYTEFWQDVGTTPLPYARINGATQSWGLAAKYSRVALANTMIFLAQNPQGGVQVMMLNGYVPNRVSNTDLEDIITRFPIYNDAIGLTYMVSGHPMYQLTFPSAQRSFLYDALTGIWYETMSGVIDYARHFANLGIVFNTKNYVSDASSGVIYQLKQDVYTESGNPIRRVITTKHLRAGGGEFGISEIRLEFDTGVGTPTGQGLNPQIMMRVSKDGGKTFGPERWKPLGRGGQYAKSVHWDRMGSSRDFVFQFAMTDPVPFTIAEAQATLSPGTEVGQ